MRHTGGTEVQLSWGIVDGVRHGDLTARIAEEVRIFKKSTLEKLATFHVLEAKLVQVSLLVDTC